MAEKRVRITCTWDVPVAAEYGDTDQDLLDRAERGTLAEAVETKTLLPDSPHPLNCELSDAVEPEGNYDSDGNVVDETPTEEPV